MNANTQQRPNPFPGLRPFRSDEHHLFFGREEQTAALVQLLRKNRFLAVVGTSGSGKSSLVRAGMIAELHSGTMTQAGSTWEVVILRPGGSPIENLARAFVEADLYDADDPNTLPRLLATLSRSRFGLVEAVKQSDQFEPETNLLVVVDQFEELFRFRQQGVGSEETAAAFVNLLLTACEQAEHPIYVTITMRSDYLGDCSEIPGLAEAVNAGEYLIPRLLRDQKRDAIEKPIGVGGAKISPLLVQRLLNDVGDDPDQLPVLQHALMRMWDVWSANGDRGRPIDFSDFESIGGLEAALSNHADEIYDSLPDDGHRNACERIFKSLTEKGTDNRGIRRPARLTRLELIAGADLATITVVLDAFRQPGVTFLMPGVDFELDAQTVLDLSHESLMRGWRRLRGWVEEEAQSARIFRRLLDTAWLWREKKAGLFRDPDLQIALSWREQEQPNGEWAEQYGGQFDAAIRFLESSEAAATAEIEARESVRQRELEQAQQLAEARQQRLEQQQRAARKLRSMIAGLAVVAVIAGVACVAALVAHNKASRLAEVARREAVRAQQNAAEAGRERENTQQALDQVAAAKDVADENLRKAVRAEDEALVAEKRSREFRYATDMQLAARLIDDKTANVNQVLARLAEHDPAKNAELQGKDDLRGFEWHYLKSVVESRATVFSGFDKPVVDWVLTPQGELVTLDEDANLQCWDARTREQTRPARDLKKGRRLGATALSPDGLRVALAIGAKVHLLDTTNGEENVWPHSIETGRGMIFSPDSRMLITLGNRIVWWDVTTGAPIAAGDSKLDANGPLSISRDGMTLAVGRQGAVPIRRAFSVFRMKPETREIIILQDKMNANFGSTETCGLSPDGQLLAVSQMFSGEIRLYDTATGRQLRRNNTEHAAPISAIGFNPNGDEMVTASEDGAIKVWKDYQRLQSADTALMGHAEEVTRVTFAAEGTRVVSSSRDKTVRIWELTQESARHQSVEVARSIRARFSPDGLLIASTDSGHPIRIIDAATGQVVRVLPQRDDGLLSYSVAFSPDNRMLAVGFGGARDVSFVELWDLDGGERVAVMPGTTAIPNFNTDANNGMVAGLEFSPDGKWLVACFGSLNLVSVGQRGHQPLAVYDVAARRMTRWLDGHKNFCISVTFSRDGSRMASGSYDQTAIIWDTKTWRSLHVLDNPDAPTETGRLRVFDVAFSPDGSLLAMASFENNVIIWDAATGKHLETLRGHANGVRCVSFSPDGRTLASGSDNSIRLWNVATWRELTRLDPGVGFNPHALAFSPEGSRLLSAAGRAFIWSTRPSDGIQLDATAKQLEALLDSRADFQSRIRMLSENLRLHEALEALQRLRPADDRVQQALAAARANWHASRRQWREAAGAFDQLQAIAPPHKPEAWFRTPGLLRLATALLHQGRSGDAAALLTGGAKRRVEEGLAEAVDRVGLGLVPVWSGNQYQVRQLLAGFPGSHAGLRPGDVMLKLNDIELTSQNPPGFRELSNGEAGTKVRLSVRHAGSEQPEVIELTYEKFIQDADTGELLHPLRTAINDRLAQEPRNAGLLELRAELAGQWNGYQEQAADYTAALEVLAEQSNDAAAEAIARLHRRRGDAHVGMKQWQRAVDDYARVITDETTEERLLANQALAQAEVLRSSREKRGWIVLEPVTMISQGGATLKKLDDNSILAGGRNPPSDHYNVEFIIPEKTDIQSFRLEALTHDDLPDQGPGRSIRSARGGVFALIRWVLMAKGPNGLDSTPAMKFREAWADHSYNNAPLGLNGSWNITFGQGTNHTSFWNLHDPLKVEAGAKLLSQMQFNTNPAWSDQNLGRFRLSVRSAAMDSGEHTELLAAKQNTDPWKKLAIEHRAVGDQPSIDELVVKRPQVAGPVGDLFAGDKDWRRAIEIYARGITGETADADLLAKRARAHEALEKWDAAAADWVRAAAENPDGAKLLAEFSHRLALAGQRPLAAAQRERSRQLVEAALEQDPENMPAAHHLAQLLFEMSEPPQPEWTVLKPAEMKSQAGATLTLQEDGSILVAGGTPEAESDTLEIRADAGPYQALRIETTTLDSAPKDGGPRFNEYQILSTRSPSSAAFQGQYVRIDLPGRSGQYPRHAGDGDGKILSLAEVQIFHDGKNLARTGKARQSTSEYGAEGNLAIDGNTDGNWDFDLLTITHTLESVDRAPWWEVDLGSEKYFDRIVIWNRRSFGNRLSHFRICVLDASRNIVFEQFVVNPPNPSLEISRRAFLANSEPANAGDERPLALRLMRNPKVAAGSRFRLSVTSDLSVLDLDLGQEEKRGLAMSSTDVRIRLATAYSFVGEAARAAEWAGRALDDAETFQARKSPLESLLGFDDVLAELVKRQPDDVLLQLTQARSFVQRGTAAVNREHPDEAQPDLQRAREIFTRLISEYPRQKWVILEPTEMTSQGRATLTRQPDGSLFVSGKRQVKDVYTLDFRDVPEGIRAIRLEAMRDDRLPGGGPGTHAATGGNFVLSEFRVFRLDETNPSATTPIPLRTVFATYNEQHVQASLEVGEQGWSLNPDGMGKSQSALFALESDEGQRDSNRLRVQLHFYREPPNGRPVTLGRFRLSVASDPVSERVAELDHDLKVSELADLDVAIGKVTALQGNLDQAASAYAEALDRSESPADRRKILDEFAGFEQVLAALAKRRPDDDSLQRTLARNLARSGQKNLSQGRWDQALVQLDQARQIFARLIAEHPRPEWTVLQPTEMTSAGGATLTRQSDGSVLASGLRPPQDVYTLTFTDLPTKIEGLRLELLPHESLPQNGPGRAPGGDLVLTELTAVVKQAVTGPEQVLLLTSAVATHEQLAFPIAAAIDQDDTSTTSGWTVSPNVGKTHSAVFELDRNAVGGPGSSLTISLIQSFGEPNSVGRTIGRFRVSVTSDPHAAQAARLHQDLGDIGLAELEIALANTYAQRNRTDDATVAFGRALDLATDLEAAAKVIRETSAHADLLEKLASQRPGDARFHDALARHFTDRGDTERVRESAIKARALYEQRLEAEPGNSRIANDLADLLLAMNPLEWAALTPMEVTSDRERNRLEAMKITAPWLRLAAAYRAIGDPEHARATFVRALEMAADGPARAAVARQAAAFNDVVAELLKRSPDDKWLLLGHAKYQGPKFLADNQFQEAVDLISPAIESFPQDVELLNLRADAHRRLKKWQAAISDLERIMVLEADEGKRHAAALSRAEALLRLGQTEEAAEAYTKEMLLFPVRENIRNAYAAQLLAGHPSVAEVRAAELLGQWAARDTDADWSGWLVRMHTAVPGLITQQNQGRLLKAAEIAGGDWTAPLKAAIYYRLGDLKQAQQLLTTFEDKPQFQALAAMLLHDQGETSKARKLLKEVENWLQQQRAIDPESVIPAQVDWQDWSLQLFIWREATRKLSGSPAG